jgi:ribosomal protein S27E
MLSHVQSRYSLDVKCQKCAAKILKGTAFLLVKSNNCRKKIMFCVVGK